METKQNEVQLINKVWKNVDLFAVFGKSKT